MLGVFPPDGTSDVGSAIIVFPPYSDMRGPSAVGTVIEDTLANGSIRLSVTAWQNRILGSNVTVTGRRSGDRFSGEVRGQASCTAIELRMDRDPDLIRTYWDFVPRPLHDRRLARAKFGMAFKQDYAELARSADRGTWTGWVGTASALWDKTKSGLNTAWKYSTTTALSAWAAASAKAREALALPRNAACRPVTSLGAIGGQDRPRAIDDIDRILLPAKRSLAAATDSEKVVLLQAKLVEIKQPATDPEIERYRTALAACYSDAQLHLTAALSVQEKVPLTDYLAIGNALYTNGSYFVGRTEKPDLFAGLTGMMAAYDAYSRFVINAEIEMKSYRDSMATAEVVLASMQQVRTTHSAGLE